MRVSFCRARNLAAVGIWVCQCSPGQHSSWDDRGCFPNPRHSKESSCPALKVVPLGCRTVLSPGGIIESAARQVPRDVFEGNMVLWVQKLWLIKDTVLSWLYSPALLHCGQDLPAGAPAPTSSPWQVPSIGQSSSTCYPVVMHVGTRKQAHRWQPALWLALWQTSWCTTTWRAEFAWVPRKSPSARLNNNGGHNFNISISKASFIHDRFISSSQPSRQITVYPFYRPQHWVSLRLHEAPSFSQARRKEGSHMAVLSRIAASFSSLDPSLLLF